MTEFAERESFETPFGEDSESADSYVSGSCEEEEDLYSSESEMATQFNSKAHSKVNLEEHKLRPSVSDLSLDFLEDALTESRPESAVKEKTGSVQLSKQELIRQIHLRRHINQLKKTLEEKEAKVEDCRAQLLHCREHLNSLLTRETELETKVSELTGEGVRAPSLGLVTSQLDKVRVELETERNVELNIQNELQKAELQLSETRTAMGEFEEVEMDLAEGEEAAKEVKMRQAVKRLQTETQLVMKTERARMAQKRLLSQTHRDQEAQTRLMLDQVRTAQEKGKQFLQDTMDRYKRVEAAKEEKHRTQLDRQIKAMISLKKNIESSQGTMQAQQMLKSESAKKRHAQEKKERERIITEGGNPDEVFLRKQRMETFELSKESFLKKQNERQVEIINKLLEEEKMVKKAEEKLSKSHWHERQECPHPSKQLSSKKRHRVKHVQKTESAPVFSSTQKGDDPLISRVDDLIHEKDTQEFHKEKQSDGKQQTPTLTGEEELFAEPEIQGLWEKGKSSVGVAKRERNKVEEEKMREAMEKLKKSNVSKQVVAGREFKGQAFSSKPTEVIFQDFDVSKTYRKKVTLTNISYSFNYCKLVGVTDNLKDFISIDFNPPGSMSAGLTCHMLVTFEPKLNEDILGHIEMLSQTGPFTIPVKCLTKKCVISTDKTVVQFGRVCVGETIRKTVTLTNSGALSTKFTLAPKLLMAPSVHVLSESSGAEQASGGPLSEESAYSIMSNVETRPSRMDTLTIGGPVEGKVSRSVGDLSCVSQKSLSWADKPQPEEGVATTDREAPGNQDEDRNEQKEGEDVPAIQIHVETEQQSVGISVVMSQPLLTPPAPCISVGRVSKGEIGGFSSCTVELVFSPLSATEQKEEFVLTFSHPAVPPIELTGEGCGMDLPVWLERETMDLRDCMLDRLYQDTVVLHNRAPTALRVTFQVPALLQPHLEVSPKYGVIQGESSYSAQLKFTPRASILSGSCDQYLSEGGVLEMPVEVQVVDQTRPLTFIVSSLVTPSELTFDRNSIDFGTCTTHESVVATLHLTNTSLLPQSFGFISLPAFVDVQPGDGFGEILPEETLAVDVIFSARKPREYSFELVIKTEIDKTYKIPCHGVGILPALELSQNAINFSATPLNDTSTTTITVNNPRLGRLHSAVIRGALLPQGPKMFEFVVPPEYPITVVPQVGEVPLGESVIVQVQFSPRLDPEAVREEALRLAREDMVQQAQQRAKAEQEKLEQEQQQAAKKKSGKKVDPKKSALLSDSKNSLTSSASKGLVGSDGGSNSTIEPDPPQEGSELWCQAQHNLLTQCTDSCLQLSIPCFVSSETSDTSLVTPSYRVEDTLYLEVTAPIVRPDLVVDSDQGKTNIDYGSVGTGDSRTKMICIKNISDEVLKLQSSTLDPHGPFELRNALRDLSPGNSANLILRFSPLTGGKFYDHLVLTYNDTSSLRLKLSGTGVQPDISLSLDSDSLDLGHAMAEDTVTGSLQLTNSSSLAVRYKVTLEGTLPGAANRRRKKGLPFRASNYSGEPPFSCPKREGVIEGDGASCELTVVFKPDHQSPVYGDTMYIDINGQRMYTIQLKAKAWTNNMYITIPDEPLPAAELSTEEYMTSSPPLPEDQSPPPIPLVLLFTHHLDSGEGSEMLGLKSSSTDGLKKGASKSKASVEMSGAKVTRELVVGCIKSSLVKKATGEISIEGLPSSNPHSKYFSITPLKQSVEAGGTKAVTITFSPPRDPSIHTIEASTNMTLKGDSSQVYKLLFRGLICE